MVIRRCILTLALVVGGAVTVPVLASPDALAAGFVQPASEYRPETWFHLIGGNVDRAGLTTDLEAVAAAGLQGIQLFHGSGRAWPGVEPQIQTLSPEWDGLIAHVGRETARLGLQFTMQNCPGWAMSGGPWITPDRAMRHLIWSRTDVAGGGPMRLALPRPQPSQETWRDYREVAVLAFPTPQGDTGERLRPVRVRSNRPEVPWRELLAGVGTEFVPVPAGAEPAWVEVAFDQPVVVRTIELPPVSQLTRRRVFDPGTAVRLEARVAGAWIEVGRRAVPRGNWQDRLPELRLALAYPDQVATEFRVSFLGPHPLALDSLGLHAGARSNDWRGQAGYVLRSLERAPEPRQDPAAWVEPEAILDLSDRLRADGSLDWDAPPGNWTVVRFGHVNTGVKNKPAPPEATGWECDKLSPLGAEQHFAGYIGRLTEPGAALGAGRLQGMLIDSWECYTQTWTPAMEREFGERRGYALRRWLPALAGWVVGDHGRSERFLRDWRATISDLLVQHYFGRLAELGRARGLQLSFETAVGDVAVGDILQYFGKADVPMCEFWQPNDPHWGGLETKPVLPTVSAARLYGKPRIAAEAFTHVGDETLAWDEHPFSLKHQADRHFALGINHLVFHTYTHNPAPDPRPGTSFGGRIGTPFVRGQTWWNQLGDFTTYLARCQFLLQQGRPVADVLWYLGDDLDHKPRQDEPFPEGFSGTYLNADVLQHRLRVEEGRLRTPEGLSWRVLWLAPAQCRRLTPATLVHLHELLEAGATVIGPPPVANPSLAGGAAAEADFHRAVAAIWGDAPAAAGDRRVGRGRILWGGELAPTLASLGLEPDVAGARSIVWGHRQTDEAEIYFLAGPRHSAVRANLSFRAAGRAEWWDPVTGQRTPVAVARRVGERTVVPLALEAAGSVFLVFSQDGEAAPFVRATHDGRPWLDPDESAAGDTREPYPAFGLRRDEPLQPWVEPLPLRAGIVAGSGGAQLRAWENGAYQLERADGAVREVPVTGTRRVPLAQGWTVAFPPGWDAPERLSLERLTGWSELADAGARAFSGTATYAVELPADPAWRSEAVLLDLGRVECIAEVRVNGETVGTRWTPPFRFDLGGRLTGRGDRLEVRVTSTWRNRLIHDAGLPEAERRTWTLNGPPAGSAPAPAGLLGPVELRLGRVVPLDGSR